jgi:hypothetical protein
MRRLLLRRPRPSSGLREKMDDSPRGYEEGRRYFEDSFRTWDEQSPRWREAARSLLEKQRGELDAAARDDYARWLERTRKGGTKKGE